MMIRHSSPWISERDSEAVAVVTRSGMLAQGALARQFESAVASYIGYENGVAAASGGAAFQLILQALDIGPEDEVILPTYVCKTVRDAISSIGATPVLCDVSGPWCMTPHDVLPLINGKTKAIVLVHMFGIDASAREFRDLDIPVIDDHCQSFGLVPRFASRSGLAFCSFHATKCLTTGEGGMALIQDAGLYVKAREMRDLRVHGRLSDLQAALGLSQLQRYPEMLERRAAIAGRYFDELDDRLLQSSRDLAPVSSQTAAGRSSIFFRFPVRVERDPQHYIALLESQFGVCVRRGVDHLLHDRRAISYPKAELLFDTTLSLPLYPSLNDDDVSRVIDTANRQLLRGVE